MKVDGIDVANHRRGSVVFRSGDRCHDYELVSHDLIKFSAVAPLG